MAAKLSLAVGKLEASLRLPRYILLSLCGELLIVGLPARRAVHGLDATAAQTFGTLFNMLESLGVELVITHMENPEMEKLLRAHGVIGSNCCMCAARNSHAAKDTCHASEIPTCECFVPLLVCLHPELGRAGGIPGFPCRRSC